MGSISGQATSNMGAVVTGANRGIGLEIARQLAEQGVTVVLTARDERRGADALQTLRKRSGLTNIVFHQLDVQDPLSIRNLVEFMSSQFGKLDTLVNNAGASGASADIEGLKALNIDAESWLSGKAANIVQGFIRQTYGDAVTCFDKDRQSLFSERRAQEKVEKMLDKFLEDMRDGELEGGGWPAIVPIYSISKAALNAYTSILARRHHRMHVNCMHPGHVKTDLNFNTGVISAEEGARGPVMLCLLPEDGPSGFYFDQTNVAQY